MTENWITDRSLIGRTVLVTRVITEHRRNVHNPSLPGTYTYTGRLIDFGTPREMHPGGITQGVHVSGKDNGWLALGEWSDDYWNWVTSVEVLDS